MVLFVLISEGEDLPAIFCIGYNAVTMAEEQVSDAEAHFTNGEDADYGLCFGHY